VTLRDYLDAHDLKLHEFAEASGLSVSYLSRLVNRRLRPSMEAAIRIHRATGGEVTFEDLVGDELAEEVI